MVVKVEPGLYSAAISNSSSIKSIPCKIGTTSSTTPATTSAPQPSTRSKKPTATDLPYREYCGNAKRITVESNCQHLRIIGNGNRIFVHRNHGRLEVLGNSNRVRVLENRSGGRISYTGNGGRVYLCRDSPATSEGSSSEAVVRYTGVNGTVRLAAREELLKALAADAKADADRGQRRRERRAQCDVGDDDGISSGGEVPTVDIDQDNTACMTKRDALASSTSAALPSATSAAKITDQRCRSETKTAKPSSPMSSSKNTKLESSRSRPTVIIDNDDLTQQFQNLSRVTLSDQFCVSNLNVSLGNLVDFGGALGVLNSSIRCHHKLASKSDLVINGM